LKPQMLEKCVGAFTDGILIIIGARMSGHDVTRLAVSTEWSYSMINT